MESAIKEIINKNSGENAIRRFSEFRFSDTIGISKQVDAMARMVDEFFPEEMQIKTYEKGANGKKQKSEIRLTPNN